MTAARLACARLCSVLAAENAALEALDLRAAAGLVGDKAAALAALEAARPAPGAAADPDLAAAAGRLCALAEDNRRLLARAILVQGRVLATIARACRASAPPPPRYGARGALAADRRPAAAALSARA